MLATFSKPIKSADPLGRRRLEWWFYPLSLSSFDPFYSLIPLIPLAIGEETPPLRLPGPLYKRSPGQVARRGFFLRYSQDKPFKKLRAL